MCCLYVFFICCLCCLYVVYVVYMSFFLFGCIVTVCCCFFLHCIWNKNLYQVACAQAIMVLNALQAQGLEAAARTSLQPKLDVTIIDRVFGQNKTI